MPHGEKTVGAPAEGPPETSAGAPEETLDQSPSEAPGDGEVLTEAAAARATLAVAPEIVANSLGEYARGWFARVRAGESGVLPVIVGLIVIAVIFQSQNASRSEEH